MDQEVVSIKGAQVVVVDQAQIIRMEEARPYLATTNQQQVEDRLVL